MQATEESYEGSTVINWHGDIDALGRKTDADFLTQLLEGRFQREKSQSKPGSLVLNINAPWGTGKTFLLDHWAEDLDQSGWAVLRFNAWQHDYASDPLLSFIAAIDEQVRVRLSAGTKTKAVAKRFSTSLAKNLAPAIAKSAFQMGANLILGPGAVASLAEGFSGRELADSAAAAVEKAAENLLAREKALSRNLEKFRKSLAEFASAVAGSQKKVRPLLLMIDELDRCRPDFAIDLLEVLKHVFSVPGVYTVVATDTKQLASSAKNAYGNEFEAVDYLKRFFDLQYELVVPDSQPLALHLLIAQDLHDTSRLIAPVANVMKFGSPEGKRVFVPYGPSGESHYQLASRAMIVAAVTEHLGISNRDMVRLIELIRAVLDSFVGATVNENPKPALHFLHLTMLAGAYLKDRESLRTKAATKELYQYYKGPNVSREFPAGPDQTRSVSGLLSDYQASLRDIRQKEFGSDRLGREIADSLLNRPGEFKWVADYGSLVSRCGQLMNRASFAS